MDRRSTKALMSALLLFGCSFEKNTPSLGDKGGQAEAATTDVYDDSWLLPENNVHIHENAVQFAPGSFGTTIVSAVIRGDRDVYILRALAGQRMTLSIGSMEDNAVFDVLSPGKRLLVDETKDATFALPDTGNYRVIVGGTRGNASYTLNIMIRPTTWGVTTANKAGVETIGEKVNWTGRYSPDISYYNYSGNAIDIRIGPGADAEVKDKLTVNNGGFIKNCGPRLLYCEISYGGWDATGWVDMSKMGGNAS